MNRRSHVDLSFPPGITGRVDGRCGTLIRGTALQECYGRPFFNHGGEVLSVPVGQADAAMRFSFADLGRPRSAVNAVAFEREVNPN